MANIIAPKIWAKSRQGNQLDGESLDTHSVNVAKKFLELHHRTPQLAEWVGEPRLWHRAFWACFLHDFGKVAAGFQNQVRSSERWGHRHEVLSLAFLPWVAAPDSEDFRWMAAAIASHHKDAGLSTSGSSKRTIFEIYPIHTEKAIQNTLKILVEGQNGGSLSLEKLQGMAEIVRQRVPQLFADGRLASLGVENNLAIPDPLNLEQFVAQAPEIIRQALEDYYYLIEDDLKPAKSDSSLNRQAITMRGLILLSDRLASSYAIPIELLDLPDAPTMFRRLGRHEFKGLRDHQQQVTTKEGSIILSAPTGSGKTEAALLWAHHQQHHSQRQPTLVYLLPYQASMNAMQDRLKKCLFDTANEFSVALMHGRSTQVLYKQLHTPGSNSKDAEKVARRIRAMAGLYQPGVWVATPYQLLKSAFRLPGYEMLWTAIAGARLIIDEVHAYDTHKLGLFMAMLDYLQKNWSIELCLMTATMPNWLRTLLQVQLNIAAENMVAPAAALYAQFRRHRLRFENGNLGTPAIQQVIIERFKAGKAVLVCVNTVKEAQQVMQALRQLLAEEEAGKVILLHSRFTQEDRRNKEVAIMKQVAAGREVREPLIVVATQVIEVSLDLDFDTIFTEPAPLEALAQRFGRVNRRGTSQQDAAEVHVLSEALYSNASVAKADQSKADNAKTNNSKNKFQIYDMELVERTLKLLERENGNEIDEAKLCDWLDEIYSQDLAAEYTEKVRLAAASFKKNCLDTMRAFDSDDELEKKFDEMFEGAEVLPEVRLETYKKDLEDSALAASVHMVPISHRQLKAQMAKGTITNYPLTINHDAEDETERVIKVLLAKLPYTEDVGLQFGSTEEE